MKVAFVCSGANSTPFAEFIPLSKYLNAENVETTFLLDDNPSLNVIESLEKEKRKFYCDNQKIKTVKSSPTAKQEDSPSKLSVLKNTFPLNILKRYLAGTKNYLVAIKKLKHYKQVAKDFFLTEKPDCLILYGDRNLNIVPAAIKYAKENNIPIVVLQAAAAVKTILFHARQGSIENSTSLLVNKILKKKFPQQWASDGKVSYSFYTWHLTLALLKLKMLPKNPWIDGDSWADKHLLISKQDLLAKKKEGSLCDNTSIVGQYSHDLLHNKYVNRVKTKKELSDKYFNGSEKQLIIFAFPQFWEHNLLKKEEAYKEITILVDSLTKLSNCNILVSLHPKMRYDNYKIFEKNSPNFKIAQEERLSNILPTGAIFLSIFESTISWALLCNVVPVYLNFYGYGYSLDRDSGCIVLDDKNEFENSMKEITTNLEDYKNKLTSLGKDTLPPFDGKSGERILNEIKALIK
jgi:hypothetical protein